MCLYDYHRSVCIFIILDLDKVTDLNFSGNLTENDTAIIDFKRPRGYYDAIRIDCYSLDHACWEQNRNLTNTIKNCTNCTSISVRPVNRGMEYACYALTMKASFNDVTSDRYNFNTGE
jgi:hypothetical protein